MKKGASLLRQRLLQPETRVAFEPVYARLPTRNVRFGQIPSASRTHVGGRWYSTTVRNFLKAAVDTHLPRAARAPPVREALGRLPTAPFASTLRPKLVGGAIPRTTLGYSLGGGARYFSSSPAAPAQVIGQVSSAMRAFMLNGKGQFDSYYRVGGKKSNIAVRAQIAASLAAQNAPGAYVDFDLAPTWTCISPMRRTKTSLEDAVFMNSLSADFGAMVGNVTAVYADVQKLCTLGDLPVSVAGSDATILRVRFNGCDRDYVERLCSEMGVKRGIVHEDERFAFDKMSLGIAPDWHDMMSNASPPLSSTYSEDGYSDDGDSDIHLVDSVGSRISGSDGEDYYFERREEPVLLDTPSPSNGLAEDEMSLDFSGLQGIHSFLNECEEYRNGLTAWN